MIRFILNEQEIKTSLPEGMTILDFVRYHKRLPGTKTGCREGDCGACTVLVGDFENNNELVYRSMTSCLLPLTNVHGKHVVTVEGINMKELSPVQQAMVDANGSQCGFCTIGFVMSLTGFVMHNTHREYERAIESIDGNICRCTGYKSIERAAKSISAALENKPKEKALQWLVENNFLPGYFINIKEKILALREQLVSVDEKNIDGLNIGGATDLNVQKHSLVKKSTLRNLFDDPSLKNITKEAGQCIIGASVTVTQFNESPIIKEIFPLLGQHIKLVSSTPIRNMATLAGNIVNASPIGDMSIFFLALNASLVLSNNGSTRKIKLKDFYKGYKTLDKSATEIIVQIVFDIPSKNILFNFEKVCKRTYLDIASVNSAISLKMNSDGVIEDIHLSAGGVAPFPKYLAATGDFLKGKKPDANTLNAAVEIINTEIQPISDARGSAEYKRLLLRQLFIAHFATCRQEIMKEMLSTA
jgi:xanthine dehydrogenase small subunit